MKVFISSTISLMMSVLLYAQENALPLEELRKIASGGLTSFRSFITEENYKSMGLALPEEADSLTLDEPMEVHFVRLDSLREYRPGKDPNELTIACDEVIYPLLSKGEGRLSLTAGKVDGEWKVVSFGSPNLSKTVTKLRLESSRATKIQASSYHMVRIPALNLHFLAHRDNGGLTLIPVFDDPHYDFKAGVPMSAGEVFQRILPEAKKLDDLPR